MSEVSMMPHVDTPEKAEKVNELVQKQQARHRAIVDFVFANKQDISSALRYAMDKGIISADREHETEKLDEANILDAFLDRINQFTIANHKMVAMISTGEEDTTFPPQD